MQIPLWAKDALQTRRAYENRNLQWLPQYLGAQIDRAAPQKTGPQFNLFKDLVAPAQRDFAIQEVEHNARQAPLCDLVLTTNVHRVAHATHLPA